MDTQGVEGNTRHENGVPPPIVGRLGASGKLGSQVSCDRDSTTMVRVPGSSGALGFRRESLRKMSISRLNLKALAEEGSPLTQEKEGSPDRQNTGKGFEDQKITEEDRSYDLEEKPLFPPEVLLETTADRTAKYNLLDEKFSVKTERFNPPPLLRV